MTTPKVISRTGTTSDDLDTDYKWGFTIDIEADVAPKGLNEDIVRLISFKKGRTRLDVGMAAQGLPPLDQTEQ